VVRLELAAVDVDSGHRVRSEPVGEVERLVFVEGGEWESVDGRHTPQAVGLVGDLPSLPARGQRNLRPGRVLDGRTRRHLVELQRRHRDAV
jgi:hypothetical protein